VVQGIVGAKDQNGSTEGQSEDRGQTKPSGQAL